MPITLAKTPLEELAQLEQDVRNRFAVLVSAASPPGVPQDCAAYASKPWDLAPGVRVVARIGLVNCKGHQRPKLVWFLNGTRTGYNALRGAIRAALREAA